MANKIIITIIITIKITKKMVIIITMKIINNKTMYMKCKVDIEDMFLNKLSYELSNKQ